MNNLVKLLQILTSGFGEKYFLRISSYPYGAKSLFPPPPPPPPPPHGGHVFRRIKISRTVFEKGHTRNNLVKLLKILTSGFGEEEFLSKNPPPPPRPQRRPCFSTDQNFANNF